MVVDFVMRNTSLGTAFILGLLISVLFGLAFVAGQQQGMHQTEVLENRQILLDGKIHLIEMKVDVINEHKDAEVLQSDFEQIMTVLEQSHEYTGDGIIARDQAMRAAAAEINSAIAAGGQNLVQAIEAMLELIEGYLHTHNSEEIEPVDT
jgi:hypothetical protein